MSEPTDHSSEKQSADQSALSTPPAEATDVGKEESREPVPHQVLPSIEGAKTDQPAASTPVPSPDGQAQPISDTKVSVPDVSPSPSKVVLPASERIPPTLQGLPHEILIEICFRVRSLQLIKLTGLLTVLVDKIEGTAENAVPG